MLESQSKAQKPQITA